MHARADCRGHAMNVIKWVVAPRVRLVAGRGALGLCLENHGVTNWFRENKHARIKRLCWSFLKKKTLTLNKKWQLENVLRKVLHQAHMFLTYDYLSDSWNLIYYLETALCKWDETHTTHSMRAWCNHPYHHHLQVVAWKLPLPPFWLFQKQFCMCFCTINLLFLKWADS